MKGNRSREALSASAAAVRRRECRAAVARSRAGCTVIRGNSKGTRRERPGSQRLTDITVRLAGSQGRDAATELSARSTTTVFEDVWESVLWRVSGTVVAVDLPQLIGQLGATSRAVKPRQRRGAWEAGVRPYRTAATDAVGLRGSPNLVTRAVPADEHRFRDGGRRGDRANAGARRPGLRTARPLPARVVRDPLPLHRRRHDLQPRLRRGRRGGARGGRPIGRLRLGARRPSVSTWR